MGVVSTLNGLSGEGSRSWGRVGCLSLSLGLLLMQLVTLVAGSSSVALIGKAFLGDAEWRDLESQMAVASYWITTTISFVQNAISIIGALVSSTNTILGKCCKGVLSRVLARVGYFIQKVVFFFILFGYPIAIPFAVYTFNILEKGYSVATCVAGFFILYVILLIWFYWLCNMTRSLFMISEAGGDGWEYTTAEELIEATTAKKISDSQVGLENGPMEEDDDGEEEPLLVVQGATAP